MSVFTHGRLRTLARPASATLRRRLSEIEAEVLRWAARGKTAWETSQILHISERKLMTKNKTATVAVALVNREIVL